MKVARIWMKLILGLSISVVASANPVGGIDVIDSEGKLQYNVPVYATITQGEQSTTEKIELVSGVKAKLPMNRLPVIAKLPKEGQVTIAASGVASDALCKSLGYVAGKTRSQGNDFTLFQRFGVKGYLKYDQNIRAFQYVRGEWPNLPYHLSVVKCCRTTVCDAEGE